MFSCDEASVAPVIEEPTEPQSLVGFLLQNTGQAYGKALSVDSDDNFYYTSLYQGNISGTSIISSGIIDNYFAKHDKNGNLIWERSFGGAGSLTHSRQAMTFSICKGDFR